MPCMLACFAAGIIGSVAHYAIKKEVRYSVLCGAVLGLIVEACHMLLLCAFGLKAIAAQIALPIMLSNVLAMSYCLYIYKKFGRNKESN